MDDWNSFNVTFIWPIETYAYKTATYGNSVATSSE